MQSAHTMFAHQLSGTLLISPIKTAHILPRPSGIGAQAKNHINSIGALLTYEWCPLQLCNKTNLPKPRTLLESRGKYIVLFWHYKKKKPTSHPFFYSVSTITFYIDPRNTFKVKWKEFWSRNQATQCLC